MTELLTFAGSFATVWLITWLACCLVLTLVHGLVRRQLRRLHPADATSVLLLLLAFPILLSLAVTTLLFTPAMEAGLVSAHCHENCLAHAPTVHSVRLAGLGLVFLTAVILLLGTKLIFHLNVARRLMRQLRVLAEPVDNYWVLEDDRPLVFTLGWWRNRIFLTSGLLRHCNETELAIILTHENAHARRLDNVRLLLARLFLLVLPPAMAKKLYADLHVLTEAACDLVAAGKSSKLDVASTLLKVQRLTPRQFGYGDALVTSAFTGAETEQRIRMLLDNRTAAEARRPTGTAWCALGLLVCSVLLVDPLHHGVELLLQFARI